MPDLPSDTSRESRDGTIVTFYSYKGGTGRTMALANVAWILAANGLRVLVADWDLESPGLHRFFHPFLPQDVSDAPGIVELIRRYAWMNRDGDHDETARLIGEHARVQPYAWSMDWEFPGEGSLDFLSAGRQNSDYLATLSALDWDNFYETLGGGEFFDALRADMKRHYDYVLIDSRTGLSDVADICAVHLPDIVLTCFTLSAQGIEGAAGVARRIKDMYSWRGIRVLPVPMRVDPAEKEKAEAGRVFAVRLFAGLPAGMSEARRRAYWNAVEVPYQAFYAYEETLAVFGDQPGVPGSLLASYERLTAEITEGAVTALPPVDGQLRTRIMWRFARQPSLAAAEIIVEFCPEDEAWAEWISGVLAAFGTEVRERRLAEEVTEYDQASSWRRLVVASAAYVARHDSQPGEQARPDLAVYVTGNTLVPGLASVPSAHLHGVSETAAIDRLYELVVPAAVRPRGADRAVTVRYPGNDPALCQVPARNLWFTGRDDDLTRLRGELRDMPQERPIVLQGLGGVGKTQLAMEYAQRFKSGYDLVWWIDCAQPQFIAASLADLAARMQDALGVVGPPVAASADEAARHVLELLRDDVVRRWLLVYDDADDIDAVLPYLPVNQEGGHVLITSRNSTWADRSPVRQVDVFTRAESAAHLRRRVPSITTGEAHRLGEVLGDLPLAVATAAAWLAETNFTVSSYLEELESRAPRVLSIGVIADYPHTVARAWDLSLSQLQERSLAAVRLLEMFAVMAPRIAVDLVYSPAVAGALEPYDRALSEPMLLGRVVQEISRFALIKFVAGENQIDVHRLVQAVVRDRMDQEQLAAVREDVHEILADARPRREVDDPQTWSRYRLIWPHLVPSQAVSSRSERVRQLFIDWVRYLLVHHDLERGREEAASIEAAWEEMLAAGGDRAFTESLRGQLLRLRFNVANILRGLGQLGEAKALHDAVLSEQQERLGADHPFTLMTAGSLAADLRAIGRYRDALSLAQSTYQPWTALYGEGHERTLAAAHNLAQSYLLTGGIREALRLDLATRDRNHAVLGPMHPQTLESSAAVARDLMEMGNYADALAGAEAVHRLYSQVLGEDSLEALNTRVLLGIALRSAGRPDEADPQFTVAAAGLARRFGGTSVDALACRLSGSLNLLALGRTAEAAAAIGELRAAYEVRLGPQHPHTLVCALDLAAATWTTDAARSLALTAAEGLRNALGEDHPYSLAAAMLKGTIAAYVGDLEAAAEIEARATTGLERVLGASHPDTLRCRANLLITRQQLGDGAAAFERARTIDSLATLIGADHPEIGALRDERRIIRTVDLLPS